MFWMGIYPQAFLRKMDTSVNHLLNQVKKKQTLYTQMNKDTDLKVLVVETTGKDIINTKEDISR